MKHIIFILAAFLIVSCTSNPQSENQETVIITKHSANISSEGAISTSDFLTQFQGKDSMYVKMNAVIEDVCAKKGCWMTLILDDETTMMVSFKDYEFFVPKDAMGKLATVEGVATIDTISVAAQRHYLEDAEASQDEIDAITEPEITYAFEAVGVIIKEETKSE